MPSRTHVREKICRRRATFARSTCWDSLTHSERICRWPLWSWHLMKKDLHRTTARSLNLDEAIAHGDYTRGDLRFHRESFVSNPEVGYFCPTPRKGLIGNEGC